MTNAAYENAMRLHYFLKFSSVYSIFMLNLIVFTYFIFQINVVIVF